MTVRADANSRPTTHPTPKPNGTAGDHCLHSMTATSHHRPASWRVEAALRRVDRAMPDRQRAPGMRASAGRQPVGPAHLPGRNTRKEGAWWMPRMTAKTSRNRRPDRTDTPQTDTHTGQRQRIRPHVGILNAQGFGDQAHHQPHDQHAVNTPEQPSQHTRTHTSSGQGPSGGSFPLTPRSALPSDGLTEPRACNPTLHGVHDQLAAGAQYLSLRASRP